MNIYRGEAEWKKVRFTWPAWRSSSFPGIKSYYYNVLGGELLGSCVRSLRGKGVAVANFRPAVVLRTLTGTLMVPPHRTL